MKIRSFLCVGMKSDGTPCTRVHTVQGPDSVPDDELVPYYGHPSWPFLCPTCANSPARNASRNTRGIVEEPQKRGII